MSLIEFDDLPRRDFQNPASNFFDMDPLLQHGNRGGFGGAPGRFRSQKQQSRYKFQSMKSSYVFDTILRRAQTESRQDLPKPIPSVDNDIVRSQAWLPQLECVPTEHHKEEDELDELFATQMADVFPIPKFSRYGRFKLYFFDVRDLGEPIRLIFHYMKQDFKDVRIADGDWEEEKNKFPLQSLPALEHDGMMIQKSAAIARYLADLFGLAGKDRRENALIDEFMEVHLEAMAEFEPFLRVAAGIEDGEKQEAYEKIAVPAVKRFFPLYSSAISRDMSGFLVGNNPTWPDFYAADFLDRIYMADERLFRGYEVLFSYFKGIMGMKNIRSYVESRRYSIL